MKIELTIINQGTTYHAAALCEDGITLTSERRGSPAKLEFSVMKHDAMSFQEGNEVEFIVDGVQMFRGFVFKKSRDKEQIISVTAYDQMRYLKNKATYIYENKTAAELLTMIAGDYNLQVGDISDTGYIIPYRSDDSQSLMDIIYTALDLTLINTGTLYVLYDDFGKLSLKAAKDMKLNQVVSSEYKMTNYSYATDIDTDTYNRIVLIQEDEEAGTRTPYGAMDNDTIKRWGILQYYEKVDSNLNAAQIQERANQLLDYYNRVKRTLSVENLAGDLGIRAGCSLVVNIPGLGDIDLDKYLVISKCTHTFKNNEHTMKLDLEGLE